MTSQPTRTGAFAAFGQSGVYPISTAAVQPAAVTRAGIVRKAKHDSKRHYATGGLITISTTYGYIRVNTREQNKDRQLIAMRELSISEKNIFPGKQSGKDLEKSRIKF